MMKLLVFGLFLILFVVKELQCQETEDETCEVRTCGLRYPPSDDADTEIGQGVSGGEDLEREEEGQEVEGPKEGGGQSARMRRQDDPGHKSSQVTEKADEAEENEFPFFAIKIVPDWSKSPEDIPQPPPEGTDEKDFRIEDDKLPDEWFPACGAAVLAPQIFVTAAHCLPPKPDEPVGNYGISIRVGSNRYGDNSKPRQRIASYVAHPNHTGQGLHDIGLVFVDEPFDFTPDPETNQYTVNSICEPFEDEEYRAKQYVAIGFQTTRRETDDENKDSEIEDSLKKISMKPKAKGWCKAYKKEKGDKYGTPEAGECDENFQIQAQNVGQEEHCVGDSGGPLVYYREEDGRAQHIGVASWTVLPCTADGSGGTVYTRVNRYHAWIREKVAEWEEKQKNK